MKKVIFFLIVGIIILVVINKFFLKKRSVRNLDFTSGFENILNKLTNGESEDKNENEDETNTTDSNSSGATQDENMENSGSSDILPTAFSTLRITRVNSASMNADLQEIKNELHPIIDLSYPNSAFPIKQKLDVILNFPQTSANVLNTLQPYILEIPVSILSQVDVLGAYNQARKEKMTLISSDLSSHFYAINPTIINELLTLLKNENGFIVEQIDLLTLVKDNFIPLY